MEKQFVSLVTSQTAVTNIIAARFYPVKLPQAGVFPAMVYTVISGDRDYNQDGQTDLVPYLVQLDLFAESYSEVVALRDAIVASMTGVINQDYGSPAVCFSGVLIRQERDGYTEPLDASDSGLFRKSIDVEVWAA